MKKIILISFLIVFKTSTSQTIPLDTIKTHCTICTVGNYSWGDHDGYYAAKKCPRKKKNDYLAEHLYWADYVSTNRIYWAKLYDINDKLIFEGMSYSDCIVGPFVRYYLSGQIRIKGSYDGYSLDIVKGYVLRNCNHTKIGEWVEYSETGQIIKKETFNVK